MPVLVDGILHFQGSGGRVSARVFKLKQARIQKGKPLTLFQTQRLKAKATSFDPIPAPHRPEVQVNGKVREKQEFDLHPAR